MNDVQNYTRGWGIRSPRRLVLTQELERAERVNRGQIVRRVGDCAKSVKIARASRVTQHLQLRSQITQHMRSFER